ncbi:MAG: hypothetical protein WC220_01670 [Pedobacter sp.]
MFSYGQTTAFGVRVTPSYIPGTSVENPSASNIYGPPELNINVGVYVLKYFKGGPVGIKAGLEFGAVPYILGVYAPRNAFGTGAGGDKQINVTFNSNPLGFAALTISPAYKIPIGSRFLELTAGPSVRFYNFPKDDFYELMLAFNRAAPYNPDDPSAGPPDVRTRVTDLDLLYLSFPVSADYVIRTGRRGQVKFGLMYNISKPLSGELDVQMYGKSYQGFYRPRTGFWGFNVQYERLSKRSVGSYQKRVFPPDITGRYRKALFVETFIPGGLLSANYDMRLKKDINHGLGFSAGAGLGGYYLTEVTNNNKTTDRRMLALPIAMNYIIGAKQHGLELGIGVTPQIALDKVRDNSADDNGTFIPLRIGYRLQPKKEGFTARAALIPIIKNSTVSSGAFNLLNFGVSCGYSFR